MLPALIDWRLGARMSDGAAACPSERSECPSCAHDVERCLFGGGTVGSRDALESWRSGRRSNASGRSVEPTAGWTRIPTDVAESPEAALAPY
jgi:hypothetical protein